MYVCWYNNAQQPAIPALPGTLQYAPTPVAATSPPAALPAPPELLVPITAQQQILSAQQSVLATVPLPRKRGSEELMSLSPMVTNGTSMSPQHAQNDITNDAKKVKLDENQLNGPSRVVHIRSLPHDVTETDIVQLGMPFGKMINVLLLKQKNQAFLEFTDEMSAQNMVAYYQTTPAQVRSKLCYVQFSNHKALNIKTDALHAYQNATAQAALQAAQAVMHARNPGSNPAALLTQESSSSSDQPCILRIIIDNILYPVTLEVLHQVFSRFGKVSKIITFTKNNQYQALIQFADCISARTAKDSLDGQNIYNGCDTLKIDYSKLTNLNVKYNNDKSRDYTRPDLPSGDAAIDQALQFCDLYTNPSPGFGGLAAMPTAMPGYGPLPGAFGTARLGMPVPIQSGSSVILVSNLDEQSVAPDALFTLFGVYGDVHRVKILFNKKDNALIQMAEPNQAQLAITFLDKVKVWGKPIRVAQSKHSVVQMPKDGQPDAGLTKDYTNSPLHRFKRPGSKNCQNIFPPSGVLHLSNIPPNVEESEITDLFSEHGTVKAFKFFPKDRKMALIQMNTVDEAVIALIALHNHQLSESSHLRVSFSKSTI
ncbi:polypyrimidine tract-binding protein 1-like isoform X10 [Gigantopelta aegis]|uniref:polypyrimidine tract-binding protein 1-like isoform X10 n=1 Tax=Gigantopelta aegis TaxID=1735272 RepID=UPI001B88A647|nr:polypyrimidine tract-binding protein 1-like isoform X10 [Gigantopelta aegis]